MAAFLRASPDAPKCEGQVEAVVAVRRLVEQKPLRDPDVLIDAGPGHE